MQLINQLNNCSKLLKKAIQDVLEQSKSNLTTDQWLVLARINELNEPNQSNLANLLHKETASVSRIIDILEKKNLVRRKRTLQDRRSFIIIHSVDGSRLYRLIKGRMNHLELALDNIDIGKEMELIKSILSDMSTIYKKIID